ncbi:hypothetical protein FRC17_004814 [Serendipita sp. 399]|nr:hypothetical protein FRC17_004814 [Serendipita sp. 399]
MHASSPERWRRLMPDTPRIVFLVCLVAVFTTLKSAAALYILFLNSIVLSDSPLKLAVASFHNWVMVTSPLMTHFVDLAVQSYYISLLYNLFKADAGLRFGPILRWTLFIGISLCFMLATATGILAVSKNRFLTAPSFVSDRISLPSQPSP